MSDSLMRRALRGLIISLLFALMHAALGIMESSWWYLTLSAYYVILSVLRFSLLRIRRKADTEGTDERFAEKFTGWLFLAMSWFLSGTVIMTVINDHGTQHHLIAAIALSTWVFTRLTLAIIHLIHARRNASPVIRALRNIALAEAFVSLMSLQRVMLASFPGMTQASICLMNALTGTGVCVLIFMLGLNLIGGKRITMAKSKIVKANEKIAETVVKGYKTVEDAVVGGYKKMEESVVGTYTKVEDKFIDKYLTREGETVEEAKARLKKEEK